jgi:hypothetical protein
MIEVSSSNLRWVDYDEWTGTLTIGFHSGRVYRYYGVGYQTFVGLLQASSHGKFFHAEIRDQYRYSRVN